jgi:hypothetical protein
MPLAPGVEPTMIPVMCARPSIAWRKYSWKRKFFPITCGSVATTASPAASASIANWMSETKSSSVDT